jgi:hypothetical protein
MEPDDIIVGRPHSPYQFGESLATCGDRLLVGAPYREYADGMAPPCACVFRRSGRTWQLEQSFTAPVPKRAEGFARALALGTSNAIVGAAGHENGDAPTYDFARESDARLRLRAELDSPERVLPHDDVFDEYGVAIAADDTVTVVGASLESGPGGDQFGAVHVFDRRGDTRPITTLRGTRPGEGFGTALALSGDLLVVGATASVGVPGAVHIFRREAPDRWRAIGQIAGTHVGEQFGEHVAISGTRIAISAPGDASRGTPIGSGRVDVYELRDDAWVRLGTVQEQPGFGVVALSGDRLAIGDRLHPFAGKPRQTGRVGLYRIRDAGITREGWLELPGSAPFARLGTAVVLGPDFVAAGAPGHRRDGVGVVAIKYW